MIAAPNTMAAVTNATPLTSLDAVVIDTETAGIDPRKACAEAVLSQQLEDIHVERSATNAVAVKCLSARERARLQTALQTVSHLDVLLYDLLFKG